MRRQRRHEVEQDAQGEKIYEVTEELEDNQVDEISTSLRKTFQRCPNCGTPLKDSQAVRGTCAVCKRTATCTYCEAKCFCGRTLCNACRLAHSTLIKSVLCCPDCLQNLEQADAAQSDQESHKYYVDKLIELERLKMGLLRTGGARPEGGVDLLAEVRLRRLTREIEQLQRLLLDQRAHE